MVFPTFFNFALNFAISSSWSEPQSAPGLILLSGQNFCICSCKQHYQSDSGVDHMMMSMCKVAYFVVGRGCLLWPVCSLGKTLLAFALLHFVLQGQTCLSRFLLTSYFCIPIPYGEKNIFFGFSSRKARKSCRPSEIWSISASSALKGQGSLAWCSSWRFKELYMTYQLNNNNQKVLEVFTERINFSFFWH